MQPERLDIAAVGFAQKQWTVDWHVEAVRSETDPFLKLVEENHWHNFSLWHEEDKARRDDLGFEHVYHAKRAIDRHNQLRNNAMEAIDACLIRMLKPDTAAPLNSETPGMMMDRLSIMALKEFHMAEEVARSDVDEAHRIRCGEKLGVIRRQRADLTGVLAAFVEEVKNGARSFKVYFQFKMYNDPSLNPELYAQGKASS